LLRIKDGGAMRNRQNDACAYGPYFKEKLDDFFQLIWQVTPVSALQRI